MAASTFLIIGVGGLILLGISALLGSDDAFIDADSDVDVDVDLDGDGSDGGSGGGILEWLSVKAMAVAAVGFGFVGWAATSNGSTGLVVWTASLLTSVILWAVAVKLLFPWLKKQEGNDLQSVDSYNGLRAEVVVRIPPNGVGTVQFTHPGGSTVRRDARSTHKDHEVAAGTRVVIELSTSEHVVVDEFLFFEDNS